MPTRRCLRVPVSEFGHQNINVDTPLDGASRERMAQSVQPQRDLRIPPSPEPRPQSPQPRIHRGVRGRALGIAH
jgi:hypothetical protein